MSLHIQIAGLNGQGLYSPNSINEMETLIGGKVVLLKEQKPQFGLGGIVNVFRTAKLLNIHLDIGDKDDTWGFLIIPDEKLRVNGLNSFKREALWQIRKSHVDYPLWSQIDYEDAVDFFEELRFGGGWPSKTGNPSGSGRYNNI
ncbi:MAG: hypothetical protein L0G58_09780 [Acinetobacter sp.]|uniref:hypothetical protein n=1 Tax=Acinetobacter sp. TaxID=472 RepID=UPI002647A939|nr:hypothetical protein [Acinetobacter sp.]MDN5513156.1 hypothetical protein [Acinetobacter sp.]MDN5556890.1 hypothetical protein [Acinetobacter sp.]